MYTYAVRLRDNGDSERTLLYNALFWGAKSFFLMIISEYRLSCIVDGGRAHLHVCSYHMQYVHGISAMIGRPFSPPLAFCTISRTNVGKHETAFGSCKE